MNLQTAKIVAPKSKMVWSQVHTFDNLMLVIKIEAGQAELGRQIITRFQEEYRAFEGKVLKKLEASLNKIQEENVAMVVGVVSDSVLYLGILNQGKAVLLREGKLVTILEAKEGVITASGFLKENDCFVLGTERLFRLFSGEVLKANLANKEPEEAVEVLAPLIHESGEDGGVAGIIVKLGRAKARKILPRLRLFRASAVPETKQQRMMMTIAVVLAGLLLVSFVFGFLKRRQEERAREINQIYEEIEYKYQEGKELIELHPIRARELLAESLDLVRANQQYKKIKTLEKEIEKSLEKVLGEYELAEVPVWLDLDLVKEGLGGIDFDLWEEKIVVLGEDGTVVKLDFNKKAEILGKVEKGKLVTFWGEKAFVFGETEKDWSATLQSFSDGANETVDFKSFAGNLYLLAKNGIFQYPAIEEGFAAKRSWLGAGVEPDLSQAVDMAIDGDLWVLLEKGEILKFAAGAPKAFGTAGLDKALNEPTAFYTDEDCKKIYVLDKGNKKIVVFLKSGEYDSQYLWEGIENISDIVVSENERKILLLSKNKIYEIEIK